MKNDQNIIRKLFNFWLHLNHKLIEFETTFSDKKDIEELREKFLPDFFSNLNELYWNYFFLAIAKLLDPYRQGQNTNLSLFTLVEILKQNKISEWKKVEIEILELKRKNKSIIEYRKKNLAHFDFEYSIGQKKFDASTHIKEVDDFFNEMLKLINITLKLLNLPEENSLILKQARFKGADELNYILMEYKDTMSNID